MLGLDLKHLFQPWCFHDSVRGLCQGQHRELAFGRVSGLTLPGARLREARGAAGKRPEPAGDKEGAEAEVGG